MSFALSCNTSEVQLLEIGTDTTLFEGLYISQNKEFCEKYMGNYPVVFLSLKSVDGLTFKEAQYSLCELIASEIRRFKFLLSSDRLDDDEKNIYRDLISLHERQEAILATKLKFSLKKISELLYKHYGQKTIVLIDEYDVPLDKAFQHDYYREMVSLIRGLFGEALKTNDFLQFTVLTGCLRVSKESIFTGLNNQCLRYESQKRRKKDFLSWYSDWYLKKLFRMGETTFLHMELHFVRNDVRL